MCVPMDTLCELQVDFDKYIQELKIDQEIEQKTVSIGIFNGKEYIFSEIDGQFSIIIITPKKPELTQIF